MSQNNPQHKSSLKSKIATGGLLALVTAVIGLATALVQSGALAPFISIQKPPAPEAPSPSPQLSPSLNSSPSASISPAPSSSAAPTVNTSPASANTGQTFEISGFRFANQGCKRQSTTITCSVLTTAQDEDKVLYLYNSSRLIDQEGQQYKVESINLGGDLWQTNLVKDVPIRAKLVFEKVPQQVSQLALVEINGYGNRDRFNVQFRDVTIATQQ